MENNEEEMKFRKSLATIFELIEKIERKFPVDSIKLSDGTKIWNLIRVLLYFYLQKQNSRDKGGKISLKIFLHLLRESFSPLNLYNKKIDICGFSGTESRKFRNGKFYDTYIDPLCEVLGDGFYVFEWATPQGHRIDYRGKIYSKNYVPMHIPVFSKTFWDIGIYRLLRRKKISIKSEETLQEIITFFSKNMLINNNELKQHIYDSIMVFSCMKKFFVKLLSDITPIAVLIRCGYGRFHMALSQACREFDIPSIELQHGIITKYHAGYVKAMESENRECVPEYLLTYGDTFTNIVRKGYLFSPKKVVTIGFPYLEEVKLSPSSVNKNLKNFISNYSTTILVTSQWTVADEVKKFFVDVSKELKKSKQNIGLIFKPHPRDWRGYSEMKEHENIYFASKYDDIYEILKIVDIHSTVHSTSGIEALAFCKPNIFADVGTNIKAIFDIVDGKSSFLATSPQQFIEKLEYITSNYASASKNALNASEKFFKQGAKKNFEKFLNSIGIKILNG